MEPRLESSLGYVAHSEPSLVCTQPAKEERGHTSTMSASHKCVAWGV